MKCFYRSEEKEGYVEIVGEKSGLDLIRLGQIRMQKGCEITLESGEYEIGLVILSGKCNIECNDQVFPNLGIRGSVFTGKPTTVYIPRDSRYKVAALGYGMLEVAVCKVKADKKYEPFAIYPHQVSTANRGRLNWQRKVVDIITNKYEGKVDKIVLGETYNKPGQWSGYPPHKHDADNLPFETAMEEVYHFRVNPGQGFGIQVIYNDQFTINECHIVRDKDSTAIKNGYHPVASAPGYQVYYLWVMAGKTGRGLAPKDDAKHAWIKAVEQMLD